MSVLALLDGPVVWVLLCFICPVVTVVLVLKAIRKSPAQNPAPQMANPHARQASGIADHQVSRNGKMLGTHTEADLRGLLASHVLLQMPNVVVTPHIAYNTADAMARIVEATAENVRAFARGAPRNVVRA